MTCVANPLRVAGIKFSRFHGAIVIKVYSIFLNPRLKGGKVFKKLVRQTHYKVYSWKEPHLDIKGLSGYG